MIPTTIILASANQHKVDELRSILTSHGLDVTIVPVTDVWPDYHVDETGSTFEENAMLKALAVFEYTGLAVLADDSGLEVDALQGAPGVISARYSGENATDATNRTKLLAAMADVPAAERSAQFRCVLCYMDGTRTLFDEGIVRGMIASGERGDHGFGYDPVFVPDGHQHSFAELDAQEKNSMSHRGRATASLIQQLHALAHDTGHAALPDPLPRTDALIMASVAAVTQHTTQLRSAISLFVRTSDDALLMYEALLQTYLFAGFPAALDALVLLDDVCSSILGSITWPSPEVFNLPLFHDRGARLCERIYEGVYERMMQRLGTVSPDLAQWMIIEGYGKTLARPQLDIVTRELCTVGVLAALGREQQLYSHVRGALLVGASAEELSTCADIVVEHCGKVAGERIEIVFERLKRDRV